MTRALSYLGLFLSLAILQTSFFSSLPGMLAYTPFLLASGIYLTQHAGERFGAYVVAGTGIWLAILGISTFPFEWVSYAAAGFVASASARHVFSNRSWYGLVACGALTVSAWAVTQALLVGIAALRHPELVSWQALTRAFVATLTLNTVLLSLFFAAAAPIRRFLAAAFLLSRERKR